jgi:heme/copper-type cytochrome/quinol oxidase subunit 4
VNVVKRDECKCGASLFYSLVSFILSAILALIGMDFSDVVNGIVSCLAIVFELLKLYLLWVVFFFWSELHMEAEERRDTERRLERQRREFLEEQARRAEKQCTIC